MITHHERTDTPLETNCGSYIVDDTGRIVRTIVTSDERPTCHRCLYVMDNTETNTADDDDIVDPMDEPWPDPADIVSRPDAGYGPDRPPVGTTVAVSCNLCARFVRVRVPLWISTADDVVDWMMTTVHDLASHPCPSCRWEDDTMSWEHGWSMSYDNGRTAVRIEDSSRYIRRT